MKTNSVTSPDYSLTVKSKKDYLTALFAIFWLCFFVFKAKDFYVDFFRYNFKSSFFDLLFYMICFYLFYQLIWILIGQVNFIVRNHQLVVKTGILFIKKTEVYNADQIDNLRIEHDVQSNSYWNLGGVRLYGFKSNVLMFDYNKRKITLGLNLENFDIDQLKKSIK
jgi:hypothetical protein